MEFTYYAKLYIDTYKCNFLPFQREYVESGTVREINSLVAKKKQHADPKPHNYYWMSQAK